MPAIACAAAAIVLLIAAAAGAGTVPGGAMPRPAISDMQTGRLLIRAGRLEHARVFLLKAKPSGEEEQIERLFLLGRIEMRLGMPKEAVGRFEDILALRTGLTRVRLELARAYYLLGQHDRARRQFSASLGDKLPSSVEAAVENFLKRIDARKRWLVSLTGAVLPESNPAKRTDREEVRIGGVPFRLNDDARASSGVGGLIAAGVSFSPALGDSLRGVLAASGAAKLYNRSDWNDFTVSADAGLTRLFDRGSVFRRATPRPALARRRSASPERGSLVPGASRDRRRGAPDPVGQRRLAGARCAVGTGRVAVRGEPRPPLCARQAHPDRGGTRVRSGAGGDGASQLQDDRIFRGDIARLSRRPHRVPYPGDGNPPAWRPRSAIRQAPEGREAPPGREVSASRAPIPRIRALYRLYLRAQPVEHSDLQLR